MVAGARLSVCQQLFEIDDLFASGGAFAALKQGGVITWGNRTWGGNSGPGFFVYSNLFCFDLFWFFVGLLLLLLLLLPSRHAAVACFSFSCALW